MSGVNRRHDFCSAAAFSLVTLIASCSELNADRSKNEVSTAFLHPCSIPGDGYSEPITARCGALDVSENHDDPDGSQLKVNVLIIPARSNNKSADPVFYFEGGPGGGSTTVARTLIEYVLPDAQNDRDIVFVDQRGSGGTNALTCPKNENSLQERISARPDLAWLRTCLDKVQSHANLDYYSTEHAANDIDAVRIALGYTKINLFGSSYGTRLALSYMNQYPDAVRSAVLTSVLPLDARQPQTTAPDVEAALSNVIAACASDVACNNAYPDLADTIDTVAQRLKEAPVHVPASNVGLENEQGIVVDYDMFARSVRGMMYFPEDAANLPFYIHRAAQEDFSAFAKDALAIVTSYEDEGFADGLYYTITCTEDFDFADIDAAKASAEKSLYGDLRIRNFSEVCSFWPRANLSEKFIRPVTHEAPVLIFSGAMDPVTPPHFGDRVASSLSNSKHVVIETQGHNVTDAWPGCATRIVAEFFAELDLSTINYSCAYATKRPTWRLPSDAEQH